MDLNNKTFTIQEINILIEALDSWVEKDLSSKIMGDIFEIILLPPHASEELKLKHKIDRQSEQKKSKEEKKIRTEQSIFLKAKLLSVRDSVEADNLFTHPSSEGTGREA